MAPPRGILMTMSSLLLVLLPLAAVDRSTAAAAAEVHCDVICNFQELQAQCDRCKQRHPMRFGKRSSPSENEGEPEVDTQVDLDATVPVKTKTKARIKILEALLTPYRHFSDEHRRRQHATLSSSSSPPPPPPTFLLDALTWYRQAQSIDGPQVEQQSSTTSDTVMAEEQPRLQRRRRRKRSLQKGMQPFAAWWRRSKMAAPAASDPNLSLRCSSDNHSSCSN